MSNDDLIPKDLRNLRRVRRGASPDSYSSPNISPIKSGQNTTTDSNQIPNQVSDQTHNQACDIKDIETGIIVPYRAPPGITPPGSTPLDAILSELREISRSLHSHERLFTDIRKYLSYETPTDNWLEIQTLTTVATPGALGAISQDTITDGLGTIQGYDTIDAFNLLQGRNAQRVWLVNDGVSEGKGDNLYLRTSPDGHNFSPEFIMLLGEIRIINDVYEIRYRSPTIDVTLRASEREIYPPYVTTVENTFTVTGTSNRPNFIAQNVAVNLADSTLPDITIPDGFSLAIRANVNNIAGSQIYISRVDATVAANRNTLNVGDATRLYINNANLIHVAGTQNGLSVDLLTELT